MPPRLLAFCIAFWLMFAAIAWPATAPAIAYFSKHDFEE